MSIKNFIQAAGVVAGLATSPISHAWDIFEPQIVEIKEVCTWKVSVILGGKNICELSSKEVVEISQDGGKTWKILWVGSILALDLAIWLWVLIRSRRKIWQGPGIGIDIEGSESNELVELTYIIEESPAEKIDVAKKRIEEFFEGNNIFEDKWSCYLLTFQVDPGKESASEAYHSYQIIIEKWSWKISFFKVYPNFSWFDNQRKWNDNKNSEGTILESVCLQLELMKLYNTKFI